MFDRFDVNYLSASAILVAAVTLFILPNMTDLVWMGVLFVFQGIAMGYLDTGGNVLLLSIYGTEVGPYMQALHCGFGLGAFISPLIVAAFLTHTNSLNWAFYTIGMAMLTSGALVLTLPAAPPRQNDEATGSKLTSRYKLVLICVSSMLCWYVGAEVGMGGLISKYIIESGLLPETGAAYAASVFWGALAFGRALGIVVSLKFSSTQMLAMDYAGCLFFPLLILLFPDSLTLLYIGAAGFGLSMASVFPAAMALADEYVLVTGKIASVFVVGASLGEMLVPAVQSIMLDQYGPFTLPLVTLIAMAASTGSFLFLVLRLDKKPGGAGGAAATNNQNGKAFSVLQEPSAEELAEIVSTSSVNATAEDEVLVHADVELR
jgi:FHS family Na+ dependent glucose MFS transporter 1